MPNTRQAEPHRRARNARGLAHHPGVIAVAHRSVLTAAVCLLSICGAARAETVALTCKTASSSWDLKIDMTQNSVNGAPAVIGDTEVTWSVRWPSGGTMYYKLDRTSGTLLHRQDPGDASWMTDSRCQRSTSVF